jgi:hypothetical protein
MVFNARAQFEVLREKTQSIDSQASCTIGK